MNDKNMTILDKDHRIGRIWTAAALIMMVILKFNCGFVGKRLETVKNDLF